jgi:membrane-associated protease RseP (regulator of RpoE activity)
MRLENIFRLLRLLFRTDGIIAEIELRAFATRLALGVAALLIAVFALIMLGIAGFYALEQLWGPIWAALAVAGANVLLALILVWAAALSRPGRERDVAIEVHRATLDSILAEAKMAGGDIRSIESLLRHPFDSALIGLIGPLATLVLRNLRKTSSDKKSD